MTAVQRGRPNKRLKLPGSDRSKGSGVLCADVHELSFNYRWRRRASCPQLTRDPLGGAALHVYLRPPHRAIRYADDICNLGELSEP